jgi:protein-disulfide isomerase
MSRGRGIRHTHPVKENRFPVKENRFPGRVLGSLSGLLLLAAIVGAAAAGAAPISRGTLLIAGIPQRGTVLGAPSAPVTLIQYEDLGCSHCLEYTEQAFPTIVKEYIRSGRVKVDFRGLGVVTPASEPALRYTLAAARQNRMWQLVALYYENQAKLNDLVTDTAVTRLVRGVKGLDVPRLLRDARSPAVAKQVRSLLAESIRRKVEGTPWFFVRRGSAPLEHVVPDAYDGEAFRALLDEALAGP